MASLNEIKVNMENIGKLFPISCPLLEDQKNLVRRVSEGHTAIYEIDLGKGYVALSVFPASLHVEFIEGKNLNLRSVQRVLYKMAKACKVEYLTGDIDSWRFERVYEKLHGKVLSMKNSDGKITKRMIASVYCG